MIQHIFPAFGTVNTITAFDTSKKEALEEAKQYLKKRNEGWSVFLESGEISAINRAAGERWTDVHPDTWELLQKAVQYGEATSGVFDITMQPLIDRWNLSKYGEVPTEKEIRRLCALVDYKDILLQEKEHRVMLKHPCQAVNLGGIAKGYAVDRTIQRLQRHGIKHLVLNFGGTVAVLGEERQVGLQHPFKKVGEVMGKLSLKDEIAVTSGSYERGYVKDRIRYHHILDPRTGKASATNLLSVTVVGTSGILLDVMATTVFILGIEKGVKLLQRYGLQAVFVTEEQKVFVTEGLRKKLVTDL